MSDNPDFKEVDKEFGFAVLVRGEMKDEPFWAYVSIFPSKYEDFIAVQESGKPYRLTDYGDIIEYEIGQTDPSVETARRIEEEYGVDHDFQDKLEKVAKAANSQIKGLKIK